MTDPRSFCVGLLDTSAQLQNPTLAAKLRSLTISWTRYDYRGPIFEGSSIEEIVAQALEQDYRHCLVQAYGHVIMEPWTPPDSNCKRFYQILETLIGQNNSAVVGQWEAGPASICTPRCLLVDVDSWRESEESDRGFGDRISDGPRCRDFPSEMAKRTYFLGSDQPEQRTRFAGLLDSAIAGFDPENSGDRLTADQERFLRIVKGHTQGAERGVFLWNVESYLDIAEPAASGFGGPVENLYCVAAGFKPNMILNTHGCDANTRVVYFDYSVQAIEFKKLLHEEWDGEDFPRFLEYVFRKLPSSETLYHLWNDKRPEEISASDFDEAWQFEVDRWGGGGAFREHWQQYRRLAHEFVHCNILTQSEKLFERLGPGHNDVIWWSNAFFTVYSNWFYTLPERRATYDTWVNGLADRNPSLHLYGFDYNNIGVNAIQADEYRERYFRTGRDYLKPANPCRIQIRC